jgi:hypothetical protein
MKPGCTYGHWTVLRQTSRDACNKRRWWCVCRCGNERSVVASRLARGLSRSCGCRRAALSSERSRTHGESHSNRNGMGSSEYIVWCGIISRCHSPSNGRYDAYGGRGISVYPKWRGSFEEFVTYVGRRPSKAHSLDRINNDGNYEPGNVRWATRIEQQRNKRTNHLITIGTETLTLIEWSERSGNKETTIYMRLQRGQTPEQAVFGAVRR